MATKKDKQKVMDEANAAALKAEEMAKAGGIPMTGLSPTGVPESTIGMSKSEKFFSEGRALDKSQLEGYKSSGDKGAGEGINAIREAQGLSAIANTPKEFDTNINRSVGFGAESGLRDQAGRDKALKAGIGAGLSYEEADAAVTKAYDFLKRKYGDKITPTTTPTPTENPKPTEYPKPSPDAPVSPTLPPEGPVEKGPIMRIVNNALNSNQGPERFLVKSGSLYLKGVEEARKAKAAAEAAAKAAGSTGDATKTFNMVDDAAKTAAEAIEQKFNFKDLSTGVKAPVDAAEAAAKAAGATGDATKVVGETVDAASDAAKYTETSKALNATLDDAARAAQETGMNAYKEALRAGASKEAAVAAGNAAEDAAIRAAYKDAADNVGKSFDAADEAAGLTDEATSAADEAAGLTDEAAEAAGKGGKSAAARLLEGIAKSKVGKLASAAAESRLGKLAGKSARVAGKGLRVFGRAAGPALEVYDAAKYFAGDQEVKDKYAKDVETLGQRVFQPKSVGEFAGAVGDVLSPTKNVLGTAETVKQLLQTQRGARTADASLKYAQSVVNAQNDRRRELYPDEVFEKLPKDTQRKINQSIRKEFSDAGVKTFGRYQ